MNVSFITLIHESLKESYEGDREEAVVKRASDEVDKVNVARSQRRWIFYVNLVDSMGEVFAYYRHLEI